MLAICETAAREEHNPPIVPHSLERRLNVGSARQVTLTTKTKRGAGETRRGGGRLSFFVCVYDYVATYLSIISFAIV